MDPSGSTKPFTTGDSYENLDLPQALALAIGSALRLQPRLTPRAAACSAPVRSAAVPAASFTRAPAPALTRSPGPRSSRMSLRCAAFCRVPIPFLQATLEACSATWANSAATSSKKGYYRRRYYRRQDPEHPRRCPQNRRQSRRRRRQDRCEYFHGYRRQAAAAAAACWSRKAVRPRRPGFSPAKRAFLLQFWHRRSPRNCQFSSQPRQTRRLRRPRIRPVDRQRPERTLFTSSRAKPQPVRPRRHGGAGSFRRARSSGHGGFDLRADDVAGSGYVAPVLSRHPLLSAMQPSASTPMQPCLRQTITQDGQVVISTSAATKRSSARWLRRRRVSPDLSGTWPRLRPGPFFC